MSEKYTTLEESPGMLKAFANAGLEPETNENEAGDENAENGSETQSGGTDAGSSETNQVQGDPGKDSLGGKLDGRTKQGKEEKGKVADNPGDLKLADGTVIKAGAERRHYETAQISKQRLGLVQDQLNTVQQKYSSLETKYNALESTVKQLGFENPAEVTSAITLYKDLARDPVGTLQKLLAEVKGLGHNIDGIGAGVDTAAIRNMLNEKLPTSQEQQGPTQEQINEQAAQEVQTFIARFPDAITHEAHIAALIDRSLELGKPLSLSDAYFMFKERVVNDGYDWNKPLGPQIEARKTPQTQETKPRTQGRAPVNAPQIDPTKVVHPERELDSDSIVRAAMAENGFQLK